MAAACALGMDISLPSGPFGAPLTSEQTSVPFLFSQCFTTTIVLPGQLYGTFNCRGGGCCALTETEARAPNSAFVKRFLFISSPISKAFDHGAPLRKPALYRQPSQRT